MQLQGLARTLIDGWQRSLPLVPRPFAAIGARLGASEAEVVAEVRRLVEAGIVARVGATVRPNTAGASLLAAMQVPPADIDRVASIVSAEPAVNHNYEREHDFNLWFVVTAPDATALRAALARLGAATGLAILELPMERPYYLDLGFPLDGRDATWKRDGIAPTPAPAATVEAEDRAILAAIEDGIDVAPRPFLALARRTGLAEGEILRRIGRLVGSGVISRFGLIVRHRALGIAANAMTVWDIPDEAVDDVGARLAAEPSVTLCYRRPRRLPAWPYNLFAMVHGRERQAVAHEIDGITRRQRLGHVAREILFSKRCFAQRGARFKAA